jgi:hypothetical protein
MAENEEQVVETTETGVEPVVDTTPAGGDEAARAAAALEADPGPGGAGGEGAKSLAEALSAGLESAPKKGEKPAVKAAPKAEGEDGKDKGDGKTETDEEKAAREKAEKEAGKKEADHINDPIDERLSERAQERIRSLVGFVKERDEALTVQGNLISAIQDTKATPEQFAEMIGFMRAANSGTPEGLEQAYQMLRTSMRTIALQLGKPIPEVDLLADHADLSQAVKFGQITKQHAEELAVAREQGKFRDAQRKTAEARTKTENDAKTERDTAISDLNALGQQLAKDDPDYQRKFDTIVPALKAAFEGVRPSQWKEMFTKAYKAVKLPALPKPNTVDPKPAGDPPAKKPQPIRPVQPAGGGGSKTAPKSMLEALSSGMEQAR